ncbi:MAG: hypothetical protein H6835_02550 [Planctomycetes bacterium]|nr:hypothetical protein [Planctomycetota bacterium]
MATPRPALSLLAAALLLPALSAAQQRRPLLGTVVDSDGEPLAGAEVVCAFAPPGAEANQVADLQHATADARGRFRVDVFACTRYRVWALGPPADDGARLASEVQSAAAGPLLALRATHRQLPPQVKFEGLDAWRELGPFRVRVSVAACQLDDTSIELVDDTATLPVQPRTRCNLDLLCADGQPLLSHALTIAKAEHKVTVRPPQTMPMCVVDGAGKPVPGAIVRQRLSGGWSSGDGLGPSPPSRRLWRELGRTDDEGLLTAHLPLAEPPLANTNYQDLFFVAEKDGYRSTHSGFTDQLFVDGTEVARDGVEVLRFTLQTDEPITGRIQLAGRGVAGLPIVVLAEIKTISKEGNGWRNEQLTRHAITADDGSFALSGLTNVQGVDVHVDAARLHGELVPEELRRMAPYSPLALHRAERQIPAVLQVNLGELRPLKLQLLDGTGGPAAGADVMLVSMAHDDVDVDGWTPSATTDSAGRVALLVQPGKWLLFARTELDMAYQRLEVEGPQELSLKMEPMPAMRGRVVDADGEPIAGAALYTTSASWHSGNDRDPALERIANNLNWSWIGRTRTDAEGRFVCCFLEQPGMTYQGKFQLAKQETPEFSIVTGEDEQKFVLR